MEIRRFLQLIWRRAVVVVASAVVGAGAGFVVGSGPTTYQARAIVAGRPLPSSTDPYGLQTATILHSYAVLASTGQVAAQAIQTAGAAEQPAQLAAATAAQPVPGTYLVSITVTERTPAQAARMATSVAAALVAEVRQYRAGSPGGAPQVGLSLLQQATIPTTVIRPPLAHKVVEGVIFGLVASIAVVLLVELLDDSVRSDDQIESRLARPVVGAIPLASAGSPSPPSPARRLSRWVLGDRSHPADASQVREAFSVLRANVQAGLPAGRAVLLVTSADPGDGRTFVASGLAEAFLAAGCQAVVASPGSLDPGPGAASAVIEDLGATADLVLVDGPPVLGRAAALDLAATRITVLFVASQGSTRWAHVEKALRTLERNHAEVIGLVLNRAQGNPVGQRSPFARGVEDADPAAGMSEPVPTT